MKRVDYRFAAQDLFGESVRCSLKIIEMKALNNKHCYCKKYQSNQINHCRVGILLYHNMSIAGNKIERLKP